MGATTFLVIILVPALMNKGLFLDFYIFPDIEFYILLSLSWIVLDSEYWLFQRQKDVEKQTMRQRNRFSLSLRHIQRSRETPKKQQT